MKMPLTISLSLSLLPNAIRTPALPEMVNNSGFARFCPRFAPWTCQLASRARYTCPGPFVRARRHPDVLKSSHRCLDTSSMPSSCPDAKPASPTCLGHSPDHSPPPPLPIKGALSPHARNPLPPCPPPPLAPVSSSSPWHRLATIPLPNRPLPRASPRSTKSPEPGHPPKPHRSVAAGKQSHHWPSLAVVPPSPTALAKFQPPTRNT